MEAHYKTNLYLTIFNHLAFTGKGNFIGSSNAGWIGLVESYKAFFFASLSFITFSAILFGKILQASLLVYLGDVDLDAPQK
jgi:hypothetical protein